MYEKTEKGGVGEDEYHGIHRSNGKSVDKHITVVLFKEGKVRYETPDMLCSMKKVFFILWVWRLKGTCGFVGSDGMCWWFIHQRKGCGNE